MLSRFIVVMLLLVLVVAGFVAVLVGIAEQGAASKTYLVGFGSPGQECGSAQEYFDTSDGTVLSCTTTGAMPTSTPDASFPGFTDAQNSAIATFAKDLGADGLTAGEQRAIQRRVDEIAATVPDEARPHYDEGVSLGPLWGARLAWTGGGIAVAALVGGYFVFRTPRSRRYPRTERPTF